MRLCYAVMYLVLSLLQCGFFGYFLRNIIDCAVDVVYIEPFDEIVFSKPRQLPFCVIARVLFDFVFDLVKFGIVDDVFVVF